jgi:predicted cupin superfamily sugar epimerase
VNERAAELIERLHLRPHPEGGFYAEVHRSAQNIDALDGRPHRAALTSIYFLLPAGAISRWHRVLSDEVWCHLEGAPIELHLLDAAQPSAHTITLGPVAAHSAPQHTVPAGVWQAARSRGDHSLAACMVAPGFDFADFALMADDDPLHGWIARRHPALAPY